MSVNKSPNSFYDSKTIIALVITVLIFVAWQRYMHTKYPEVYNKNAKKVEKNQAVEKAKVAVPAKATKENKEVVVQENVAETENPIIEEEFYKIENNVWEMKFSNYGLGLVEGRLKKYKNRDLKDKKFENIFDSYLLNSDKPMVFDVVQTENQIIGTYSKNGSIIKKKITFFPKKYYASVDYTFEGKLPEGMSTYMQMDLKEKASSSLFMPSFERQEYFVYQYNGEDNREVVSNEESPANLSFSQAQVISLGSHFFAQAIVDESTLKPEALIYSRNKTGASSEEVVARMDYVFSSQIKSFKLKQRFFMGPKDDVLLKDANPNLMGLIDFGMFQVICYPILKLLKFFYSLFSNYGVAIILLTLLMRILVFPLAYRGYKSMNAMQKIQPELKKIREKHKEDPQKANLETMALMKQYKVNPVGGCMPMLLQLPIFFALYRVLSESVVMYQAPFALWIHDLSLKDPYYILPILMGVTMFVQQKLTPTAMDPTQQKIMMVLPLMFAFFMFSLPSALTLYIFVSTLFGVLQQYLFTRSKN